MSLKAMTWAFEQKGLKPIEKIVLLALADYANDDGDAWPGQVRLADKVDVSDRTIRSVTKKLAEHGLISISERRRESGSRTSNIYRLLMQPENFSGSASATGKNDAPTGKNEAAYRNTASGIKEPSDIEPSDIEPGDEIESPKPDLDVLAENLTQTIWDLYPQSRRMTTKVISVKVYAVLREAKVAEREPLAAKIIAGLRAHKASWDTWPVNDHQFIPMVQTWLNQERWLAQAPERRGNGTTQSATVDSAGRSAPYGLTPGGRRMGPPATPSEHPRSPWLGMEFTANRQGTALFRRNKTYEALPVTDQARRILNGADD